MSSMASLLPDGGIRCCHVLMPNVGQGRSVVTGEDEVFGCLLLTMMGMAG